MESESRTELTAESFGHPVHAVNAGECHIPDQAGRTIGISTRRGVPVDTNLLEGLPGSQAGT